MDYFENIAAVALGPINPSLLEEAIAAYKKGVTRMVRILKKLVPLITSYLYMKS
jgi:hypothetical protein